MSGTDWSPKVARAMHEFSQAAPIPPTLDASRRAQPRPQRGRVPAALIAAALVVTGVVGTVAVLSRDSATPSAPVTVEVHHSQYLARWDAQLDCATPVDNGVRSVVIDTWSDRSGRRWRTQMTYPDGTTHDVILEGSVIYPTAQFVRGEQPDTALGCEGPDGEPYILAAGPGPFFTLSMTAEVNDSERPNLRAYSDSGSLIEPFAADSRNRSTQLWEQQTTGYAGYGNSVEFPMTQVTRWWVDATDATTVTEHTFTNSVATLGSATQTETLVVDESVIVSDDTFSTVGYENLGPIPRPNSGEPGSETTVLASPTLFDSGAALIVWVYSQATPAQVDFIRNAILQTGIVAPDGLQYLDASASLAEAQRVLAADPESLARFTESNISTMFLLFPADASTFDTERWRTEFSALPLVVDIYGSTDDAAVLSAPWPRSTTSAG